MADVNEKSAELAEQLRCLGQRKELLDVERRQLVDEMTRLSAELARIEREKSRQDAENVYRKQLETETARSRKLQQEVDKLNDCRRQEKVQYEQLLKAEQSDKEREREAAAKLKKSLELTTASMRKYYKQKCDDTSTIRRLEDELVNLKEKLASNEKLTAMTKLRQLDKLTDKPAEIEQLCNDLENKVGDIFVSRDNNNDQPADHVTKVKKVYVQLSQILTAKSVAAKMFELDALTLSEMESVQYCRSPCEAAQTLINILLNQPVEVFACFMDSLKLTNQHHIYNWLSGNDEELEQAHITLLRRNYEFLSRNLIAGTSCLVDRLYEAHVLDETEIDEIRSEQTSIKQNRKLLSALSRKSAAHFGLFLDALDKTGQLHVRNKITGPADDKNVAGFDDVDGPGLVSPTSSTSVGQKFDLLMAENRKLSAELRRLRELNEQLEQTICDCDLQHKQEMFNVRSGLESLADKLRHENDSKAQQLEQCQRNAVIMANCCRRQLYKCYALHREIINDISNVLERHRTMTKAKAVHLLRTKTSPQIKQLCERLRKELDDFEFSARDHVTIIEDLSKHLTAEWDAPTVAVEMFERGALTVDELESVIRGRNAKKSLRVLLDLLQLQPMRVFVCFLDSLQIINQAWSYKFSERIHRLRIHGRPEDAVRDNTNWIDWLSTELLGAALLKAVDIMVRRRALGFIINCLSVSVNWRQTLTEAVTSLSPAARNRLRHIISNVLNPYRKTPLLLASFDIGITAQGVSYLDGQIFTVCFKYDTVQVFSAVWPYAKSQDLTVDGMKAADIAACHQTKQLFITDVTNRSIWTLVSGTSGWTPRQTKTKIAPLTISVNAGLLLVTCFTTRDIYLYGSEGVLIKHIPLPDYIDPNHAVISSRQTFIVCHTARDPYDIKHDEVTEVDGTSHVMTTFGGSRGRQVEQLDRPRHVTLDSEDRVLVADFGNHRVLLLNSGLQLERVLLGSDELKEPQRLCLVEELGLLVVAEASGAVKIFRVL